MSTITAGTAAHGVFTVTTSGLAAVTYDRADARLDELHAAVESLVGCDAGYYGDLTREESLIVLAYLTGHAVR